MASEGASEGTTFEVKRGSDRGKPREAERGNPLSDGQAREQLLKERDFLPPAIRRKYYVPEARDSQDLKIYADPKGEYLVLQARHDRLTTRVPNAEIIRDMFAIAAHRGWKRIEVKGSLEFRREAWLAASGRGIETKGYEATPLDRAASVKLHESKMRGAGANTPCEEHRAGSRQRQETSERKTRERGERYESRSRDDRNGRSQLAIIERVALAAFPNNEEVRRHMLEVARERVNNLRRHGAHFHRVEVTEQSNARLVKQIPTKAPIEPDVRKQVRHER